MKFIVRMVLGAAFILVVNEWLMMKGIDSGVGVNLISLMISGVFGVPGTVLLYTVGMYGIW